MMLGRSGSRGAAGSLSHATAWGGLPAHTVHPLEYAGMSTLANVNDCAWGRVQGGFTPGASAVRLYLATSSGNIAVAVYADTGAGLPGARLATSGSVASPGNGQQDIALTTETDVTTGMWLALSADNTTVQFARSGVPGAGSSTMGVGFSALQATAFPPPATAAAGGSWRAGYIMIAV